MSENLEKLRRGGRIGSPAPTSLHRSPEPLSVTLRQAVTRKVKSIKFDDPSLEEKAAHAFVESVLLGEFGEGLVNNPEFQALAKEVEAAMLTDISLADDLRRLVRDLRAS
jgi:hypothetical protein